MCTSFVSGRFSSGHMDAATSSTRGWVAELSERSAKNSGRSFRRGHFLPQHGTLITHRFLLMLKSTASVTAACDNDGEEKPVGEETVSLTPTLGKCSESSSVSFFFVSSSDAASLMMQ